jgi:predicted small integral membrane protein
MSLAASLLLFKLILIAGLASWISVIAFNNLVAFRNGVFALGQIMRMAPFEQAPAIQTPLLSRKVENVSWHRAVLSIVLAAEIVSALLLWSAVAALAGAGIVADPIAQANLALSAFMATCFLMLLGGSWFAYYIRQDNVQLLHFVLIGLSVLGLLAVNLRV